MSRTVTLKLMTQALPVELQIGDEVQTWGELQDAIQPDYNLSGMKVIERTTKVSFEHKDAELPEGNLFLFVVPTKVKAGGIPVVRLVENAADEINEILDQLILELKGEGVDVGGITSTRNNLDKEFTDLMAGM